MPYSTIQQETQQAGVFGDGGGRNTEQEQRGHTYIPEELTSDDDDSYDSSAVAMIVVEYNSRCW